MKWTAYVREPRRFFAGVAKRMPLGFLNDEQYLRFIYRLRTGERLDLDDPQTYNEKLQWMKLYDRRPEYTVMVDKYAAKQWVEERIGSQYIIPTLGVWEHFDQIDLDGLPDQFVLKCTHDSGGLVIVKDKSKLDREAARRKLEKCLRRNYYDIVREWAYKDVPPRIIAEQYMTDESGRELKDYKVFTFDGVPRLIQVDYDRFSDHKRNLYTPQWRFVDAEIDYPNDPAREIPAPQKLEEMLTLAAELAKGYPHIRVDFYSIRDRIYFGELTLYHGAGLETFRPPEFGRTVGAWMKLPEKNR